MRCGRGAVQHDSVQDITEGSWDVTGGHESSPQRAAVIARRHNPWCRGQYTLEWAVLLMAVASVIVLMAPYVRDALRANVKSTELQLNGAMQDNRP